MVYPINVGTRKRWSYARLREVLDMPNLIEIQQNSYRWFLDEGLREMFRDISPILGFLQVIWFWNLLITVLGNQNMKLRNVKNAMSPSQLRLG